MNENISKIMRLIIKAQVNKAKSLQHFLDNRPFYLLNEPTLGCDGINDHLNPKYLTSIFEQFITNNTCFQFENEVKELLISENKRVALIHQNFETDIKSLKNDKVELEAQIQSMKQQIIQNQAVIGGYQRKFRKLEHQKLEQQVQSKNIGKLYSGDSQSTLVQDWNSKAVEGFKLKQGQLQSELINKETQVIQSLFCSQEAQTTHISNNNFIVGIQKETQTIHNIQPQSMDQVQFISNLGIENSSKNNSNNKVLDSFSYLSVDNQALVQSYIQSLQTQHQQKGKNSNISNKKQNNQLNGQTNMQNACNNVIQNQQIQRAQTDCYFTTKRDDQETKQNLINNENNQLSNVNLLQNQPQDQEFDPNVFISSGIPKDYYQPKGVDFTINNIYQQATRKCNSSQAAFSSSQTNKQLVSNDYLSNEQQTLMNYQSRNIGDIEAPKNNNDIIQQQLSQVSLNFTQQFPEFIIDIKFNNGNETQNQEETKKFTGRYISNMNIEVSTLLAKEQDIYMCEKDDSHNKVDKKKIQKPNNVRKNQSKIGYSLFHSESKANLLQIQNLQGLDIKDIQIPLNISQKSSLLSIPMLSSTRDSNENSYLSSKRANLAQNEFKQADIPTKEVNIIQVSDNQPDNKNVHQTEVLRQAQKISQEKENIQQNNQKFIQNSDSQQVKQLYDQYNNQLTNEQKKQINVLNLIKSVAEQKLITVESVIYQQILEPENDLLNKEQQQQLSTNGNKFQPQNNLNITDQIQVNIDIRDGELFQAEEKSTNQEINELSNDEGQLRDKKQQLSLNSTDSKSKNVAYQHKEISKTSKIKNNQIHYFIDDKDKKIYDVQYKKVDIKPNDLEPLHAQKDIVNLIPSYQIKAKQSKPTVTKPKKKMKPEIQYTNLVK